MTIDNDEYKHAKACAKFVEDAHAYLRHSFREGCRDSIILSTLAHDLGGLARREKCFLPRVSGYSERVDK